VVDTGITHRRKQRAPDVTVLGNGAHRLADPSVARREAIQLWGTLLAVALIEGESPEDCEYEIASDDGETILKLPFGAQGTIQ
jgi:hypothetical protein